MSVPNNGTILAMLTRMSKMRQTGWLVLYCHATLPVTSPLHDVLVVSDPSYVNAKSTPYGPAMLLTFPAPLGALGRK